MRLVLDAGNSSTKFGLFKNHRIVQSGSLQKGESIKKVISHLDYTEITSISKCAVTSRIDVKDLPNVTDVHISSTSIFPFENKYCTPETLGIDRIVACAGTGLKNSNFLVIDCGTCVTYDLVNNKNQYLGGGISPGISLRFKAMSNFTDKLPFITQFAKKPSLIGNSTVNSMQSGVINGLTFEIEGFIRQYSDEFSDLKIFLTGGDAIYFEDALKNSIFVDQNLVLKGLDLLTDLNEK